MGLGHVSQQDASWGLPRPAARRPGVKAICKAVHAPAKPTSHLPLWVLYYMAHGCPCGCDAAQDRLTPKHCRAFQCPCLVSHTDGRCSIFIWASSCWLSIRHSATSRIGGRLPSCVAARGPGHKRGPHRACRPLQNALRVQQ